jgi:DNA-binding SARP family transcriptional activator
MLSSVIAAAPTAGPRVLIDRPRLGDVLAGRFARRVTVIVAGPGFGKTVLLDQARRHDPAAWGRDVRLDCRPEHAAAAALAMALAERTGAALTEEAGVEEAAATLAGAVGRRALLLDDLHLVPAGSPGALLLDRLLDLLPPDGHLVVASRVPPPLSLARLTAAGQAAWLDEDDLRFTPAELAAFATLRGVAAEAVAPSAGWPALAELAVLGRGCAGRRSLMEDFLWQEVLAGLSPWRRQVLATLRAPAGPPAAALSVHVLGPMRLLRDGVPVDDPDWRRPKVRALLAHLVLHREARRERLVADLWPELGEEAGRRNLRFTLACLQRALEPDRPPRRPTFFVRPDGDRLRLAGDERLRVDLWEWRRRLEAGGLDDLLAAAELRRGPLLQELPDAGWAEAARIEVEERFVAAAVQAGERLLERGRLGQASDLARRALEADPYCEPAFRLLAAARLAGGDRSGAGRAIARCRRALGDLGAEPEPETEWLGRAIGRAYAPLTPR